MAAKKVFLDKLAEGDRDRPDLHLVIFAPLKPHAISSKTIKAPPANLGSGGALREFNILRIASREQEVFGDETVDSGVLNHDFLATDLKGHVIAVLDK